jgi:hypothetical protein
VATQLSILQTYLPPNTRPINYLTHLDIHLPETIVCIRPEGLQSVAHYQRKTTGGEVVRRYKHLTGDKKRVSQHEADAYFIAIHSGRFYATCLKDYWPQSDLTTKENHCFLHPTSGMLKRKEEAWWQNTPSATPVV